MTTIEPTAAGLSPIAGQQSSTSMLGGLDSESFMKLLVAQLRFQNPMAPSDPTDMMLQTTQLAQLDAVQQLVDLQRRDFGLNEAVMAASLLGAEVTAATGDSSTVTGHVESVRYTTSGPVLSVDGQDVHLQAVTEIRRAEE